MAIEDINLGSAPNDGTGDSLRVAGQKINDNFAELDTPLKLADIFEVERDGNQDIIKTVSLYDLQVPPESIEIGNAIKISDLAQSVGYKTSFDDKQYILMSYEIEDDGSKNPVVKDFGSPSEFILQPLFDVTQTFQGVVSFPITSQQDVIGQTYNFKLSSTSDIEFNVIRVSENGGTDTVVVNETFLASSTNLDGFDFDLMPLTDFQIGANYILQFTAQNNEDIQVRGTLISSVFVPYVKRVKGWEYVEKEVAFINDVVSYGHIGITNANPFTTTSNVAQLVDTWNFDLLQTGFYDLHVAIEWRLNATNQDAVLRFDVNGATGIEINQEPKDPSNKIFLTTFVLSELQKGINTIEFYARKENQNANILTIFSTRFTARRVNIIS